MRIFEKKNNNISLYEYILLGTELFRQRPNFLVELTEKFCQELATLNIGIYREEGGVFKYIIVPVVSLKMRYDDRPLA
jgi:hypothetical protein